LHDLCENGAPDLIVQSSTHTAVAGPELTRRLLPYPALINYISALLQSRGISVPTRQIYNTSDSNRFFVMPAFDEELCVTKLITHAPNNPSQNLPAIVGQVAVFDSKSGVCRLILDGPTVTARRTAAVTGLFLKVIRPRSPRHCLIIGAGAQGCAHAEMLIETIKPERFTVVSRSMASADQLVGHIQTLGIKGVSQDSLPKGLDEYDLIITCTPAQQIVMSAQPRPDALICAIGSYTPKMIEWNPKIVRQISESGHIYVDSRDADHEAGDLLQAGLNPSDYPCLADLVQDPEPRHLQNSEASIFFKSCGWGGWDLAAAKCATAQLDKN
jgi:1-piperideine-2-carboxylate/1-pyrroline-2-carboxylate reductase [NAD(P)H]